MVPAYHSSICAFHMHEEPENARKKIDEPSSVSFDKSQQFAPKKLPLNRLLRGAMYMPWHVAIPHNDAETMSTSPSFRVQRSQDESGCGKHGHTAHSLLMIGHLRKSGQQWSTMVNMEIHNPKIS